MPIEISWINYDDAILQLVLAGKWTVAQLMTAMDDLARLFDEENRPVAILVDLSASGRFPPNTVTNFAAFANHRASVHPHNVHGVIFGVGALSRPFILHFVDDFLPIPIVETRKDALKRIAEWRQAHEGAGDPERGGDRN